MKLTVTVLGVQVLAVELATPTGPAMVEAGGERAFLAFCAEDNGGPADTNPVGRVTPEGAAVDIECVPADDRFADWSEFPDDTTRRVGF